VPFCGLPKRLGFPQRAHRPRKECGSLVWKPWRTDIGPREVLTRVLRSRMWPQSRQTQVMVLVELGSNRAEAGDSLGEEAEGDEGPQDAMDPSSGRFGESGAHRPVNLLRCGWSRRFEDGFKHGAGAGW